MLYSTDKYGAYSHSAIRRGSNWISEPYNSLYRSFHRWVYFWWSHTSCFIPSKEKETKEGNLTLNKSKHDKSLFVYLYIYIWCIRRKGYLYLWNKTDLTSVTTSRLALYPAQTMATWMVCGKRERKRRKIKACSCVLLLIRESTYMAVLLFSAAIVKDLSGCSAAVCSPLEAVC